MGSYSWSKSKSLDKASCSLKNFQKLPLTELISTSGNDAPRRYHSKAIWQRRYSIFSLRRQITPYQLTVSVPFFSSQTLGAVKFFLNASTLPFRTFRLQMELLVVSTLPWSCWFVLCNHWILPWHLLRFPKKFWLLYIRNITSGDEIHVVY